jgi:predicted metal-dependent peptidase
MDIAKTKTTQEVSDMLMNARCRLMTREPWYGHVAMTMIWIPSKMSWIPHNQAKTLGVRIVNGGDIQCLYYPPYVESLCIEETYAVIQHEIEHIVRVHCLRCGHRNPQAFNISCDMCVNGPKHSPRIGYHEPTTRKVIIPHEGNLIWIPDDWPKDETTEFYYDKLEKRQKSPCCNRFGRPIKGKKGKQQGQGQGQDQEEGQCPECGSSEDGSYEYGGISGKAIDDHSVWNQTDVSEDEARQVIKDVVDQATEKCQGHAPGHLAEAIKALGKSVVRWREHLRHLLGKHVGNQRKTYSRRNRRRDWFGMPGISHHAAAAVVVVIDTSGSVGSRELEQFFAEIDTIAGRAEVSVLQWDAAFQGYSSYRRGDWKKFKVCGRGGTDMAAPIEWLIDNNMVPDCVVMLTDGYANWASAKNFPYICVLTTPEGTTDGPDWGTIVRMKMD